MIGKALLRSVANMSPLLVFAGCEEHWPMWAMMLSALFIALTNYFDGRNGVVR